jgi:single-strand DNA-binding protein
MADGLNKAFLIGNLGQKPELKYTQSGQAVLRCRLATNESYLDKSGERTERTDWHTVVVWGRRAEGLNKVLSKGSRIGVEGRIRYQSWEDKQGQKRTSMEIKASEIVLLDGRREEVDRAPAMAAGAELDSRDPLPF